MQTIPQEIMKMLHDVIEERNKLKKEIESMRKLLNELQEESKQEKKEGNK
jgi:regulator of replication initiation timing